MNHLKFCMSPANSMNQIFKKNLEKDLLVEYGAVKYHMAYSLLFRNDRDTLFSSLNNVDFVLYFMTWLSPVQQVFAKLQDLGCPRSGTMTVCEVYLTWSGIVLGVWLHVASVIFHWLACYDLFFILCSSWLV